ncbi:hypothetical protein AAHC03_02026 [Spirometra sp. Aus1]
MKQLNEASAALDAALERRQNREKEETLYRRAQMMSSASFWEPINKPVQRSFNIGVPLPLNMRTSISGTVYRKYSPEEKANLLQNLNEISNNYEQLSENFRETVRRYIHRLQRSPSFLNEFLRLLSSDNDVSANTANAADLQNYECFSLEPGQRHLLDLLNEIREGVYHRLLFTCQEDVEREECFNSMLKRTNELGTEVDLLKKQVEDTQNQALVETQKLDDKIADLKNDIASINLYSVENIKRLQVDDQRQRALEEKNSEGRQNKLRAEVDALKKEYEETMQQHRQKIKQANATRYKLESDLEGKYAAYDKAMFAIQSDYDRLWTAYLADKAELEAYTEKLEALREEYDGIMEEKRQEEENERRAAEKRKKLDAAASVIQAFWRSFHARKLARGKPGRKGRKGGAKKR